MDYVLIFSLFPALQTQFTYVLEKKDYGNVFAKAEETRETLGPEKLLWKKNVGSKHFYYNKLILLAVKRLDIMINLLKIFLTWPIFSHRGFS